MCICNMQMDFIAKAVIACNVHISAKTCPLSSLERLS